MFTSTALKRERPVRVGFPHPHASATDTEEKIIVICIRICIAGVAVICFLAPVELVCGMNKSVFCVLFWSVNHVIYRVVSLEQKLIILYRYYN